MKNNKNLEELEKTDLDAQNECEHWRRFFPGNIFCKCGKLVPNIQPRLLQVKNDIQSDEPHAEVKRPYMETIGTRGKHTLE